MTKASASIPWNPGPLHASLRGFTEEEKLLLFFVGGGTGQESSATERNKEENHKVRKKKTWPVDLEGGQGEAAEA